MNGRVHDEGPVKARLTMAGGVQGSKANMKDVGLTSTLIGVIAGPGIWGRVPA